MKSCRAKVPSRTRWGARRLEGTSVSVRSKRSSEARMVDELQSSFRVEVRTGCLHVARSRAGERGRRDRQTRGGAYDSSSTIPTGSTSDRMGHDAAKAKPEPRRFRAKRRGFVRSDGA